MNAPPPQLRVWQLGLGFANTVVLHALIETGVIESLRDGRRRVPELAAACAVDADVLRRALRFAAALGVVTDDAEEYALTDVGGLLLADVPGSIHTGLLLLGSEAWQRSWQNFGHALRTGGEAFAPVMGVGFFDYLRQHPEVGAAYNRWMTAITVGDTRAVADAYDFTPFETVCDVGGGQGYLLRTLLEGNPQLRGVLYDQASVVGDHVLGASIERAEIRSGDFFQRVPTADVLLLKNVLHDWSDAECRIILGNCRQAMRPASRLLVIERVVASPPDLIGAFYDLHMQVLLAGKERSRDEFAALLRSAALKLTRVVDTRSPMKILEATL